MNLRMCVAGLLLVTTAAASAVAHSCNSSSAQEKARELYAFTLFVEGAETGSLPDWRCADENNRPVLKPGDWDRAQGADTPGFQPLTEDELVALDWNEIAASFREDGLHVRCLRTRPKRADLSGLR